MNQLKAMIKMKQYLSYCAIKLIHSKNAKEPDSILSETQFLFLEAIKLLLTQSGSSSVIYKKQTILN